MKPVRKAVFPVAGMGTRFLPATKSVPKEMLPLIDRPLIQYAVDEAREAGIEEFIFITAAGKGALEDYFTSAAALEQRLSAAGKTSALNSLAQSRLPEGALSFLRQDNPLGLGHAVRLARRLIGDEPFAVLLPDDVLRHRPGCLAEMVEAHSNNRGHMVASMQVSPDETASYGIFDLGLRKGALSSACGMVEKPHPSRAPSTHAAIGRYILEASIFDQLDRVTPGAGGELQLTDAIAAEIGQVPVNAFHFAGERFDCGSVQGYVQATAAFAMDRDDLAIPFSDFLSRRTMPQRRAA